MTLPQGGTITYSYGTGGVNGITCNDGSPSTLTRTTPDTGSNQWTYAHTESGSAWSTTVTDPLNNVTDYNFQGLYETERQVHNYSPSALLETIVTCYNGTSSPCNSTGITLPITQITSTKTLGTLETETNTDYSSYGLPSEIDEYAFGSGSPPSTPLRKTRLTYGGVIPNEPTQITVENNSSTPVAETAYGYNSDGFMTSENLYTTSTSSYISRSFTPTSHGVTSAATDYNANSTSVTSFACGTGSTAFPQTLKYPDTTTITIGWNCPVALPSSTTDANGHPTTYSYDLMVRPTGVVYPDEGGVTIGYTSANVRDIYTNIFGSTQRHDQFDLNTLGNVDEYALVNDPDPSGETKVLATYDKLSRQASVTNPYRGSSGGGDSYTYDALNRVTMVTHADSSYSQITYGGGTAQTCSASTYGYGYATVTTDEVGHQRQSFTDALGRIIEVDEPNSSGTLNVNTCYSYDLLGDLLQVVQGSETRTYTYDWLKRLTSATTPEGQGNTRYFYYTTSGGGPCSGNPSAVCRRTDERGITTTYSYNNMNELTGKTYSNGDPSITYSYNQTSYNGLTIANGNGQRTGMSDASGQTAWSYDKMGRVAEEERTIGSVTKTISYTYNLDGSLASLTYPSGKTVTYTVSAVGRAVSAEDTTDGIDYVTAAAYAPQGALDAAQFGSNINFTQGYDPHRMWLNNIQGNTISPSATFFQLQPGYNKNNTVSGVANLVNSLRSQTYTYDNLNRWITAQSTATSGTYCWGQAVPPYGPDNSNGYDRYGNLLKIDVSQCSAPALNLSVNTYNQITGDSYDANGDILNDGVTTYTWNGEGQMSSAASVTQTYDGDGQRVAKSSGTYFGFTHDGTYLGYTTSSGGTENEYIYFDGLRVAVNEPTNNVYYFFSDQVGSLQMATNSTGTVCYDSDNTPTGYKWLYTNTCSQEFGIAGMKLDAESPTYHTWFRGYQDNLGRWNSPDRFGGSVSNPQSLNRYAYVMNNPMTLTDPLGLDPCDNDASEHDCPPASSNVPILLPLLCPKRRART